MQVPVVVTPDVFEEALSAAGLIGRGVPVRGLAAPPDASLTGMIESGWRTIESFLKQAYQFGREKAAAYLDETIRAIDSLLNEANEAAREIQQVLLARLQEFIRALVGGAVNLMPTAFEVGSLAFKLTGLKCTQKIRISGSVKSSLTEAYSLLTDGEFQVDAEYESGQMR